MCVNKQLNKYLCILLKKFVDFLSNIRCYWKYNMWGGFSKNQNCKAILHKFYWLFNHLLFKYNK